MHDHSLQFKADLDINGTANTLVKHEFVPVDVQYKWSNVTRSTMKLERSEIVNEDQGKMVSSAASGMCFTRYLSPRGEGADSPRTGRITRQLKFW
jgi:primary-amine oxidase